MAVWEGLLPRAYRQDRSVLQCKAIFIKKSDDFYSRMKLLSLVSEGLRKGQLKLWNSHDHGNKAA